MAENSLWVVQGHDHAWLQYHALCAEDASWISGDPPGAGMFTAKARYRQADAACRLSWGMSGDTDTFDLNFAHPQWAVTPGQSAALYPGELCLGGGVIRSTVDWGDR